MHISQLLFSDKVPTLASLITILAAIGGVVAWVRKRANDKKRRKYLIEFLKRLSENLTQDGDSVWDILNNKLLKYYEQEIEDCTFDKICPALNELKILSAKRMNGKLTIVPYSSGICSKRTIQNMITDVKAGEYDAFLL